MQQGKVVAGGQVTLRTLPVGYGSTAVVLNVTVVDPAAAGWVTVWPCDVPKPVVSNLNYDAGETIPNQVTVAVGASHNVCLYTESSTHLIVDVMGTYERNGGVGLRPLSPVRILDTREGVGAPIAKVLAGRTLTLQVAGRGGAPLTNVRAVTMNMTAVNGSGVGYLTAWPCDRPQPTTSNLNFVANQAVPNLVTTKLSAAGTLCIFTNVDVDILGDIAAVYLSGEQPGFVEVTPERILDSRLGIGAPTGKLVAAQVLRLQVAGSTASSFAAEPVAVTMNVTATQAEGTGYITVWPCDRTMPVVSNLNVVAGDNVPNLVSVSLAADGTVCMLSTTKTHLLADVAGFTTRKTELGFLILISEL